MKRRSVASLSEVAGKITEHFQNGVTPVTRLLMHFSAMFLTEFHFFEHLYRFCERQYSGKYICFWPVELKKSLKW